jgi:D-arabinose 5-phosphate isomerase GutQ
MSGIEFRKLEELIPDPDNARTHTPEQVEQIANSIRRFGFTMPGLVDEVIRAGNCRRAACELIYALGETIYLAPGRERGGVAIPVGTMPVLDCTGWTADERTAYALADNKLALNAGWDEERLREQIEALQLSGFDIPVLGFDLDELDRLFNPPQSGRTDPDALPDEPACAASLPGDLWVLGDHRLICGDATDAADVDSVLVGSAPHLMVTDPPYGVNYRPAWRNEALPVWKQSRATGVVENDDRADWREAWQLFPGDVAYIWHAGNKAHIVTEACWPAGSMSGRRSSGPNRTSSSAAGTITRSTSPASTSSARARKGHWNGDRKQSTVWEIRNGSSVGGGDSDDKHTGHGTQKPVECMRRPIMNNSKPGELVYEPFSGSGTTVIACEMEGRHCRAIELNPVYVDMAILRWQDFTGRERRHARCDRPDLCGGQGRARSRAGRGMKAAAVALEAIAEAIEALRGGDSLDAIHNAAQSIHAAQSRVIVTGMGKCSHIGAKITATLQSTGQPAAFLHPGEALHGDLGMISHGDVILALSNSGETEEVVHVARYAVHRLNPVVVMTSKPDSLLARFANHVLLVPNGPEGCPIGRAPMASSSAMLALGDALAAELMALRGFTEAQFLELHHGGYLGRAIREAA